MLAKTIFSILFITAGMASAQVETFPLAEATKAENDLLAFSASLTANPTYQSLVSAVISDLGGPASASALSIPTITVGVSEFAKNPSVLLTARPTAWETALPSDVRSAYDAEVTSVIEAQASILRHDLDISGAAPGAGVRVWGVVAGIVGVAVFVGAVL